MHHIPVLGQTDIGTTSGRGGGWAVEFDVPSHFLACGVLTGTAMIKRHHLRLHGHALVSILYLEWDSVCDGADDQDKYLWGKLQSPTNAGSNKSPSPPLVGGGGSSSKRASS